MGVSVLFLAILACNLPRTTPAEPTTDPMVAVQKTYSVALEQSPTIELSATLTSLSPLFPTSDFTETSEVISAPGFAYVTLSQATNCRVGPSTAYDIVDSFLAGQTIEVAGKHPTDNYWYVHSPNKPNVYCWMWGYYASGGNLGNVPVFTPPPSPTPLPVIFISNTPTSTDEPVPATFTSIPPTPTPTDTPVPPTPTPTDTSLPTPTDTSLPTPTDTSLPTPTDTPVPPTPTPTIFSPDTPTSTCVPGPTAVPGGC